MAERDWEVGAVLKNKPGSQGTLFRGGTKYSSPERFPRGYTPERQADVRGSVVMGGYGVREAPRGAAEQTHARLTDTIARSTVPTEHLQNVQFAHVNPGEHLTHGDTAAGIYMNSLSGDKNMIGVKPEYQRDATTIHEIGHHLSHTQGTEHSQNYSYETEHGGHEEGFADNYAEQHYRNRQGQPEERGMYGGGKYAGRIERSDAFWGAYHGTRTYALSGQNRAKEDAEYYRKYPEEEVHPSGEHQPAMITKAYAYQGEEKITSQPMDINPDAEPDWRYRR